MDIYVFDASAEESVSSAAGTNGKGEKKNTKGYVDGSARKTLGDISNVKRRPQPQAAHIKQQTDLLVNKKFVENLTKENGALMKLLSDKNKIIELSRAEVEKLRIDLQKVRLQNVELAKENSQMLGEINSYRDKVRILHHEVGCQNGLLNARKQEEKTRGVGPSVCVKAGKSSQAHNTACYTTKKQKQKNPALGQSTVEAFQDTLKVDNRRPLRRQSANFEAEELELTGDSFEIKDDKRRRLIRQLANSKDEELPTGDLLDTIDGNKRCLRRQSARFKSENPEMTKGPEVTEVREAIKEPEVPKDSFEISDNKRCLRRQSARFKTEEPELAEGQEVTEVLKVSQEPEVSDDKFPVAPLHDDVIHVSGSTCSSLTKEDGGNTAMGSVEPESRRLSIRPQRQAAERIKSYKETPINTKMRRE